MPTSKPVNRRTGIATRPHARSVITLAMLAASTLSLAGQPMAVCRDADGNAYFSDRGCPEDTVMEGRDYVQPAQTYSGRESIDTDVLNNYEQRGNSGRNWQWRRAPE
jgi:hypothetical protein